MEEDDYEEEERMRRELHAREQFLRQTGQESNIREIRDLLQASNLFFLLKYFSLTFLQSAFLVWILIRIGSGFSKLWIWIRLLPKSGQIYLFLPV